MTPSSSGLWDVTIVQVRDGFRLSVTFEDGLNGTVNMAELIASPKAGVFVALRDPAVFNRVSVEHGAVTWPGEIDLAPDAMHDQIAAHGEWIIEP